MLVDDNICSKEVSVRSSLQVVCVRVHLGNTELAVCNMYIPPGQDITLADLTNLFMQLPSPLLVVGDLNAHNPMWGSSHTCATGRLMEPAMDNANLSVLNTGFPTHLCLATGSVMH